MKKLTLILSLLLASCFDSGDNPTTPPPPLTWENEDLAGVWEMAHHYLTIEGEEDVYYSFIIFEDEPILLYGNDVRVDAFYDSLWRWIPLLPSRGGVTPTGIVNFDLFFGSYFNDVSYYEGRMNRNKLYVQGVYEYFGEETEIGMFEMVKIDSDRDVRTYGQ